MKPKCDEPLSDVANTVPFNFNLRHYIKVLVLDWNQLTSVPAALGRLAALTVLKIRNNKLTSVPAALGRPVQVDSIKIRVETAYGFSS